MRRAISWKLFFVHKQEMLSSTLIEMNYTFYGHVNAMHASTMKYSMDRWRANRKDDDDASVCLRNVRFILVFNKYS